MFNQTHTPVHHPKNVHRACEPRAAAAHERFSAGRRLCAAALLLGAPGLSPVALAASRRDEAPLQLALEAPADIDPRGWLVSEKLDGVRAWWDGSLLRFRSGIEIQAPGWFRAQLPSLPLDGELWLGRGRFEELVGIVRRKDPVDAAWRSVRYQVFDMPGEPEGFAKRSKRLSHIVQHSGPPFLEAIEQFELPNRAALYSLLDDVVGGGGEGLMLHRADAVWRSGRSGALLKLKPLQDDEAVVIGHEPGQGRNLGRLGALRVRDARGLEFRLGNGLDDSARQHPPAVGSVVTYTHQGRTAQGLPRFASFLRLRGEGL